MIPLLKQLITLPFARWQKKGVHQGQAREDKIVEDLIGPVRRFMDIGAYDGITCSNTFYFASLGASGLCFEPSWSNYVKLRLLYLFAPRIICLNEGVSSTSGRIEFLDAGIFAGIKATSDPEVADSVKSLYPRHTHSYTVRVNPLPVTLQRYPKFREVCLVSIDVEGHELEVLKSIPVSGFTAKLFVIELVGGHCPGVIQAMADRGYPMVFRTKLNGFFLRQDLCSEERIASVRQKNADFLTHT